MAKYEVKDGAAGTGGAAGILVRSQNMLEMQPARIIPMTHIKS